MATTAGTLPSETSISKRIIVIAFVLLSIFLVSGLFLAFNYWLAVTIFFVSLLLLIRFSLNEYEGRGLWLLMVTCLFVAILVGSSALLFLSNDSRIPQLAQSNPLANSLFGSNIRLIFTSIFIGLMAPLVLVVVPFIILVAIATVGILKWHKKDERGSFSEAFRYLTHSVLGLSHFSVTVDNGEIKGKEKEKARLENYGGPGWMIVYPGQVVVLHRWGKITRVVGLGSTMLKREEQIKAIVPLTAKGDVNKVDSVLTRDRISLNFDIAHAVQVELATETKMRIQQAVADAQAYLDGVKTVMSLPHGDVKSAEQNLKSAEQRLKELESDKIVGDEYNQCYESIAKLVATKAPKVWDALKVPVANNLRDVIMSEYFENLFNISEGDEDLLAKVNRRKIAEIEKLVFEKARQARIEDGVVLRVVDIQQVRFPESIETKLNEEVATLIQERIEETEARIKVKNAQSEQKRAEFEAKAAIIEARAKAQARILQGQGEGEARAALFREVLRELKREEALKDDDTLRVVIRQLIGTMISAKDLENFVRWTTAPIQRNLGTDSEETNGVKKN
ncbi:MAG: hypothetical protein HS126_05250 [Anaerolineales bacterium]|nr:hypothetical protein [Anaerolineales bacterium]